MVFMGKRFQTARKATKGLKPGSTKLRRVQNERKKLAAIEMRARQIRRMPPAVISRKLGDISNNRTGYLWRHALRLHTSLFSGLGAPGKGDLQVASRIIAEAELNGLIKK